jgi:hypothetical protein
MRGMNAPRPSGIPLRPDPGAMRRATVRSLSRACIAIARGRDAGEAADTMRTRWPDDHFGWSVVRASTAPSDTGTASALVRTLLPQFFEALGPASAGAQLLGEGLQLSFGEAGAISLPALVADPSKVVFVGEGAPIPVQQFAIAAPKVLKPQKLSVIVTLTREMIESSNAEALITDVLTRSTALGLDAMLFDSGAGTTTRPAGLRNGITALSARTAPDATEAMLADITTLVASVGPVTSEPPVLITSWPRAIKANLRAPHTLAPLTVFGSSAVAANDLIAIAPNTLVSANGDGPTFEDVRDATLHLETAPLPIGAPGTPNVVAAPTRSLWQTDTVATKLRMNMTWALRDPRGLAWLTASNW